MANFNIHLISGVIVGSVVGMFHGFPIFIPLIVIGSILPDIDLKTSIPSKLFQVSLIGGMIFGCFHYWTNWQYQALIIGLGLISIFIQYVLLTHRGIFHSIPMTILLGLLLDHITGNYWMGIYLSLGYLTHLIIDESWAFGKTSFGSAMSVFKRRYWIESIITYIFIIGLIYVRLQR